MPSVASLSTGKNFARSSVVCVNEKFDPIAGSDTTPLSNALMPLRGLNGSSSVMVWRLNPVVARLYGAPVLTLAIEDAAMPNEPP